MAYVNKYKISFRELHTDELWEVYIQQRDYSGSATDVIGTGVPLIREYRPENDNDYDWIRPSVCTVNFISETDMQFIEFFTSDSRKYKIRVYRSSVLVWAGWLLPDTYKEPYENENYAVSITATDGLLSLKDEDWKASNDIERLISPYYGKKTLMKGIEGCLNKLQLNEVHVWDASYIYEENFAQTDTDSPLMQTYFDCKIFYDENGNPEKCYDVLLVLLKSCNCQLWLENGSWNIVPQNARKVPYVRRRILTVNLGGYYGFSVVQSAETYDPGVVFDDSSIKLYATPELSFRPGWRKMIVNHDYGFSSNVMENVLPSFTSNFKGGIDENGVVYIKNHNSAANDHWRNEYIEFDLGLIEAEPSQKLKVSFAGWGIMSPVIRVFIDGTTNQYLDADGHWHTDQNTYAYGTRWADTSALEPIISAAIPIDGTLKVRIMSAWLPLSAEIVPGYTTCTYNLPDFKIEVLSNLIFYENKEITTNINDENFYIPETIEYRLLDAPVGEDEIVNRIPLGYGGYINLIENQYAQDEGNIPLLYKGVLYWLDDATYKLTTLWTIKGRNSYNRLINVISDEIAVNHIDPQYVINGSVYGVMNYGSIVTVDDKKYMILRASHNAYDKEWDLELFEIADTEQGYLKLRTGGYIKLRTGDKIKVQ